MLRPPLARAFVPCDPAHSCRREGLPAVVAAKVWLTSVATDRVHAEPLPVANSDLVRTSSDRRPAMNVCWRPAIHGQGRRPPVLARHDLRKSAVWSRAPQEAEGPRKLVEDACLPALFVCVCAPGSLVLSVMQT